ncbi:MAG: urea ABC transporter ATP-binding subunit UrtE [Spirochaetaceae bacterium]|nr:urea ABC transporter ATP-binding subunit UrtE [Myxococcales bacterium]MCB9723198.1 urea ABC transporter ATP-binding subunit UrtE [Spirochaetaceae bacterium]HPG24795.1 urea ABC transporter ATP-binding subunit UrtE [Myxococcota bacterium]
MLSVRNLDQFYGESHTLWDLSLDVPRGSCTCLMGRNGVGKTTLLKCVMGLLPIRSGEILFDGERISERAAEMRAELGIAYVPQGRDIFPRLTVEENLELGLAVNRGASGRRAYERVLETFPVLRDMLARRGGDLSGGQQQQLAVGRALVLDPSLLILDEPTEGIQPNIVQEIGETIRRLNVDLGMTVLLVEQKLPLARSVADRFQILDKGRSVANGPIDALDDDVIKRFLTV